jgi:hypothetical protein
MQHDPGEIRFAERRVRGRDDRGAEEHVSIWVERKPGALWSVGRAINVAERENPRPRPEDILFEGYEMGDALRAANEALESDLAASADNDDRNGDLRPFTETELRERLERWFFDH